MPRNLPLINKVLTPEPLWLERIPVEEASEAALDIE
jgi:hypothetical protein